ncbi:MAG: hypothetical protein ACLQU3_24695 [Limisphaerales bacterium]
MLDSIAIAGAWGYIGRKVLDAALGRGLRTYVFDPGPAPTEFDPQSVTRVDSEGKKSLRINGVDQGWDASASSYEAILTTLGHWRDSVPAATLLHGVYPNPRLAWLAFQLSGALWRSSHEERRITLPDLKAWDEFDSGYAAARPQLPRYSRIGCKTATGGHGP